MTALAGPPVVDVATNSPSPERFSCAWQSIPDEARAVARQMHRRSDFREIIARADIDLGQRYARLAEVHLENTTASISGAARPCFHPSNIGNSNSQRALGIHLVPRVGSTDTIRPGPFWACFASTLSCQCRLRLTGGHGGIVIVDLEQQGCDLQILVDAIDDLPLPAVRIFRDGHEVWCGAEHLAVFGLQLFGGDL